jgi:hypothetical protein
MCRMGRLGLVYWQVLVILHPCVQSIDACVDVGSVGRDKEHSFVRKALEQVSIVLILSGRSIWSLLYAQTPEPPSPSQSL